MCYLQHRKERIGFLLLMVCTSLLWPFLAKANLDAQKFCLYVVGLLTPAVPLYYTRKRIVNALLKLHQVTAYNCVLGFVMSVFTVGIVVLLIPYMERFLKGDIGIWYVWFAFIPCIGAYLFEIKKPAVVLLITLILLAKWSALSGAVLGGCICLAVLPAKAYPLTLEELLTMQEVPEDCESENLYIFTCLSKKNEIIPELERYISLRSGSKYLGYHYLLHVSHSLESKERFKCRLLEAEATLGLSEIDILFPEPKFRYLPKE